MEREILLFDVIEPNTAIMLDQRLSALEQSTARTCTIRINSPGGSWNAGRLIRLRNKDLQEKVIGPYIFPLRSDDSYLSLPNCQIS